MGKESGPSFKMESFMLGEASLGGNGKAKLEPLGASQFEDFISDLLARLADVSDSELDGAIEDAQGMFCQSVGLDRSCLFQLFDPEPDALILTHVSQRAPIQKLLEKRRDLQLRCDVYWVLSDPRCPSSYVRGNARLLFPWVWQQIQQGRDVVTRSIEDLPPEATLDKEAYERYRIQSAAAIPLRAGAKVFGCLTLEALETSRQWSEQEIRRLHVFGNMVAQALARRNGERALREMGGQLGQANAKIEELKKRLQAESEYFKEESDVSQEHHNMIGRSPGILRALHLVEQVAPTNSAVLLTGETGTGKELLARAIHRLSPRQDRVMVEVNCAALPEALVESELFGRERGAYTGALTSRVGRFEVADGSTIFLDEVGELSLEVQAKLLRVLQEGHFQRLGDPTDHKVNVRVVAATNRDLAQAVRQGKFREDLYYRLNVFPIHVPPLRERAEDIPLLVMAFIQEFATRMGKGIPKVPCRLMEALQRHRWPGNIRELRNVIERGVILSSGDTLHLDFLRELEPLGGEAITLAEAEQQHILKTLERTEWRIKGPHGAAHLLRLKPSTLYSRMKKLGIPHRREKYEMESSPEKTGAAEGRIID